jgi:hypothetical protein
MINYIKTVFTKPKEIYTARNMKNSHYFLLVLLTGLSLTLLSIFEILPVATQLSEDYEEVRASVPEFELVNGELESVTDSYAYQTNSILFYFDSEDKIDTESIDLNMPTQTAPISFGLLKDQIYFNAAGTSYSFMYNNFENLTAEDLKTLINNVGSFTTEMYIILILILIGLNLFLYVTQLIPITLFANLISVFRRTRLTFFQNAKISLLASMGPFILMAILNAFQLQIHYQFEIILAASILLFYISITEMKNRIQKQKDTDNHSDL